MLFSKLFLDFFKNEKIAGILLLVCTCISLLISHSFIGNNYLHFWETNLFNKPIIFWINDGLMTLFFLMVGLEIRRELKIGELSNPKKALLPIFAAIGGMFVPAIIYLCFNLRSEYKNGFGIPMATDIAFSLAILSLLGNKVPLQLKLFLTALAIIDDLGAILIIAIFYTQTISLWYLLYSVMVFFVLLLLNYKNINKAWPYLILGIILWYCLNQTGIHPTIAGVLLAFVIPFQNGSQQAVSGKLQLALHKPIAFFVIPLFTLANTAIIFNSNLFDALFQPNCLGIIFGLLIGKPLGIYLACVLALFFNWCALPQHTTKKQLLGIGILAGVGFTMSVFISLLAFTNHQIIVQAKLSILVASATAGIAGFFYLKSVLKT
jgi:Na+:H+ antiporter, NhaA family